MQTVSFQEIKKFQTKILLWYAEHQRNLPWREVPFDTSLGARDPYRILVSEVMLQQTQVPRVIPKYEAWLERFPDVQSLAAAPVAEVLAAWSGLGYNRRALFLKKTAIAVVEQFGGKFPSDEKELKSLPGIGEYTSRALLCFAFDKQVAVVDTNIKKIILTQILKEKEEEISLSDGANEEKKLTEKEFQEIADQLLPHGKAYEWNQALMDYASAMLKEHKIPIPKQSKFVGSRRYYRGQVLKNLLAKKSIKVSDIGLLIKKDFTEDEKEWLEKLLQEMKTEGFISIKHGSIALSH